MRFHWRLIRLPMLAAAAALLAACGGVEIRPDPVLPKPLVSPLPAKVALVIEGDMRELKHSETRWGVDWDVALGAGHVRLMHDLFTAAFTEVEEFRDMDSARARGDAKAVFEPRIEQYSFVTARETGGRYYAVTIRYRINLYTVKGEKADTLTLTGYGNALAKGMSSGKPLEVASRAAMRDAAAKFLVQFPGLPAGERLAKNEAIEVSARVAATTVAELSEIEAVPIHEPKATSASVVLPSPPADASKPTPPDPAAIPATLQKLESHTSGV